MTSSRRVTACTCCFFCCCFERCAWIYGGGIGVFLVCHNFRCRNGGVFALFFGGILRDFSVFFGQTLSKGGIGLLKLISASKIYDSSGVAALRSIDLHVAPGDYVSVTGASGSGKSTLMHVLGLLDTLSSGSYLLCGTDVSHLSAAALAARRASQIGFVFQQFQLLPGLTALENTALPLAITGVPRAVRLSRARTALCSVGLGDRMNHLPHELSGGQQQRVAIARALVARPCVLLADEPTAGLDPASASDVLRLFDSLHESGHTIVLITHDPAAASRGTRRLRLEHGEHFDIN